MSAPGTTLVGSLAEMGAAELLRLLAGARHSGLLKIGTTAPHWAALVEGDLVMAGSAEGPTLGAEFVAAGVVSADDLSRLGAGTRHDLALVEALIAHLGEVTLLPLVRAHTVAAVFQMLLPSTEDFAFRPGEPHPLAAHFRFPTEVVLAEAAQRVEQWSQIAAAIPSANAVFRPRRRLHSELTTVTLDAEEWQVLAVLDGRRSVGQAIAAVGRSPYDVCVVLHRLLTQGLVERTS